MSDRRKKPRMMEGEDPITLRMLMTGKDAGTLIGKDGATISRLRNSTEAIINISDNSTSERIVTATGSIGDVETGFKLISETLFENSMKTEETDCLLAFELLIPACQCGPLIGSGGSKIKSIREVSGASVQIDSRPLEGSSERKITLLGNQESIQYCVKAICDVMSENPVHGHMIPYIPGSLHNNQYSRREYRSRSPTSSRYQQRGSSGSSRHNGTEGSRRRKRSEDDDYMQESMAIPSQFAGSIIGKRGSKINEIRSMSRANIKIADEAEGATERVITCGGTPEAVGMAQFLINKRIQFEQQKANGET